MRKKKILIADDSALNKKMLKDLCAELGVKTVPMFWGVAFGWELATGYPWGFWKGPEYDLIKEGQARFVSKTAKIRKHANALGIYLCHEIHPGTAAQCADEFNMLVNICGGDKTLAVNADPSHCWEGEDWETRFRKVASRVYACHVKNFVIRKNVPLRKMEPDWPGRAMQFVDLPSGDLNMIRYAEMLIHIGYPQRYCQLTGAKTAPLIVEAESGYLKRFAVDNDDQRPESFTDGNRMRKNPLGRLWCGARGNVVVLRVFPEQRVPHITSGEVCFMTLIPEALDDVECFVSL